jgi:hypothetical protein
MKKMKISEELWLKFLGGRTTEEETERVTRLIAEDDELLAKYLSVYKAAQLTDTEPCQRPDLNLAQKQIRQTLNTEKKENVVMLPRRSNARKYFAAAAVLVALVGVALFLLFRPDQNDNNFAQQEGKRIESKAKTKNLSSEASKEIEQTNKTRKDDLSSKNNTEDVQSGSSDAPTNTFTTQKIEKNYAATQEANNLSMVKPGKDNYRVLCKNLDKTFIFEWLASNVKTLHFVVTDSKGKTIAETRDVTANHYSLKYSDIHPEQKLTWSLDVTFKDGAQERRNGQIQIDYNLDTQ